MIKNFLLFCLSFSAQVMLAQGNSQGIGFSSFAGFSKSVPKANSKVDFFKDILKLILYFLLIVLIFVVIVKLIAFCPTSFAEKVGTSISKEAIPELKTVLKEGFADLKTTVQENGPALVQVAVDRAAEHVREDSKSFLENNRVVKCAKNVCGKLNGVLNYFSGKHEAVLKTGTILQNKSEKKDSSLVQINQDAVQKELEQNNVFMPYNNQYEGLETNNIINQILENLANGKK